MDKYFKNNSTEKIKGVGELVSRNEFASFNHQGNKFRK